jgi:uncharacterized membrane-anchored protein
MAGILTDHPDRYALAAEVHARPPVGVTTPERVSYLAILIAPEDRAAERNHLETLCARFSVPPPAQGATHFNATLDAIRIKWERHSEFSGYTVFARGVSAHPFEENAAGQLPDGWVDGIPGQRMVASHVQVMPAADVQPDKQEVSFFFSGNKPVGGDIAGGVGIAFTDFKIHKDGYSRLLLLDRGMTPDQAGRMVQRLLEIEAYRMLALLALPIAARQSPQVNAIEAALARVTESIAREAIEDEALLGELTKLAADVERAIVYSQFRYGASRAYYALVRARIAELREQRLPGFQTIDEFMSRRLTPAMATCTTIAQRLRDLSERIAQTSGLLSTRVDIAREKQNQALLASMERRARLQLRLQQTVEGLSIAAISYYVVGLAGIMFKAIYSAGVHLSPEVATGLSIPVVLAGVALVLRRVRHKIAGDDHGVEH